MTTTQKTWREKIEEQVAYEERKAKWAREHAAANYLKAASAARDDAERVVAQGYTQLTDWTVHYAEQAQRDLQEAKACETRAEILRDALRLAAGENVSPS